jgi:hypothetical protein
MVTSFFIENTHGRSYVIAHFMQFSVTTDVLRCFLLVFGFLARKIASTQSPSCRTKNAFIGFR